VAIFTCRHVWKRGPEAGERCDLGPRMEDGFCVYHSALDEDRPYPPDMRSVLEERARKGRGFDGFQLPDAPLRGINLTGADLSGANLVGADLSLAQLVKIKLHRADLTNAFLFASNIQEADLEGAFLLGADLSEAWECHACHVAQSVATRVQTNIRKHRTSAAIILQLSADGRVSFP
jgi:hypothetical protein